jgi:hypothetical protein
MGSVKAEVSSPKSAVRRMRISRRLAKRLASRMGHGFINGLAPKRSEGGRLGLRKRMRYAGGIDIQPTCKKAIAEMFEVKK